MDEEHYNQQKGSVNRHMSQPSTTPPTGKLTANAQDPARRLALVRALILFAAFLSFVFSVSLWFAGNHDEGMFVGIWVPSIVALGAFLVPRQVQR